VSLLSLDCTTNDAMQTKIANTAAYHLSATLVAGNRYPRGVATPKFWEGPNILTLSEQQHFV